MIGDRRERERIKGVQLVVRALDRKLDDGSITHEQALEALDTGVVPEVPTHKVECLGQLALPVEPMLYVGLDTPWDKWLDVRGREVDP